MSYLIKILSLNKILCGYTFCQNVYLKKSIWNRSSLTWRHDKKFKICVTTIKTFKVDTYFFAFAFEKQPVRNVLKN